MENGSLRIFSPWSDRFEDRPDDRALFNALSNIVLLLNIYAVYDNADGFRRHGPANS